MAVAAAPITAVCSRRFTAVHHSGVRTLADIFWIVLHSTEGDTAEGAARWFANPKSQGSAHLVVDDTICYRTLDNRAIPWAAPGANIHGFHIEMAGHAHWKDEWVDHDATVRRAAFKTALHARLFGVPLRWVAAPGLVLGRKGVTTHAECTKAFGGDHTDPGAGFPKSMFMAYARMYALDLSGL